MNLTNWKILKFSTNVFVDEFLISSISLRFQNKKIESEFRTKLIESVIPLNRVALFLGINMYTFFLFLDYTLIPETFVIQTLVRFTGTAAILIAFIFSFFPVYKKYHELWLISKKALH